MFPPPANPGAQAKFGLTRGRARHRRPQRPNKPRSRLADPCPLPGASAGRDRAPKGKQGGSGADLPSGPQRPAYRGGRHLLRATRPRMRLGPGRGPGLSERPPSWGCRFASRSRSPPRRPGLRSPHPSFCSETVLQCLGAGGEPKVVERAVRYIPVSVSASVAPSVIRGSWQLPQKPQDPTLGGPKGS